MSVGSLVDELKSCPDLSGHDYYDCQSSYQGLRMILIELYYFTRLKDKFSTRFNDLHIQIDARVFNSCYLFLGCFQTTISYIKDNKNPNPQDSPVD